MRSRLRSTLAVLALSTAGFAIEQPPATESELEVAFEVRVLAVPAELPLPRLPVKEGEVAFLTDAQLKEVLEAALGDRKVNVMAAPKVTTFPGQDAAIRITEKQMFVTGVEVQRVNGQTVLVPKNTAVETGTTLTLRGQIFVDKFVATNMSYVKKWIELVAMSNVDSFYTHVFEGGSQGKPVPFKVCLQSPQIETVTIEKKDLKIPSGGHAAIAGPVFLQESRTETSIPVLAEIPYLNRLFTNVGYSKMKMRTVLVVSPRVIEVMDEAPMPPKVKAER